MPSSNKVRKVTSENYPTEFTTKQLEKDFRNAAYATIRTFVMKFHEMGLLTARKAGNRVFYRVGGTSDGRPL